MLEGSPIQKEQDACVIGSIDSDFLRTPPLQGARGPDGSFTTFDTVDTEVPYPREPMLSYTMQRKSLSQGAPGPGGRP